MRHSVWDGLWRPGEAFFQIGLGCVMSHHHIVGLCTFLLKFWREDWKCISCQQNLYPVAQIRLNSHKIVYSWIRTFPVAKICPNSHKIIYSWIRAFSVAKICPNSLKIIYRWIRAFPVAQICSNSHKIVNSRMRAYPVPQICAMWHKFDYSWIR